MSKDHETFSLGDWKLKNGGTIPDAHIAYKTFGDSSNPAIIYPSWYSGLISDNEWLIGEDKTYVNQLAEPVGLNIRLIHGECSVDMLTPLLVPISLKPSKYYIIITALFGNSQSSSPSNRPDIRPWPEVLFYDNVRAQHELVTKKLGVKHARAVLGWSMGAGQTYQWATQYPDFMDLIVPFCGSAKTSIHNQVFLEGVKSAMLCAKQRSSSGICKMETIQNKDDGWTDEQKKAGMKALGRVYAGWGFSQPFYRDMLYEKAPTLGFKGLEDFMLNFWEDWALSKDPENMLAMLYTWQAGDCSAQEPYNGDFSAAMKGIKAKALVLPGKTDLYFPPEDSENEVANMREGIGECIAFPSIWGHWAGGPGQSTEDVKWLDEKLDKFFSTNGAIPIR